MHSPRTLALGSLVALVHRGGGRKRKWIYAWFKRYDMGMRGISGLWLMMWDQPSDSTGGCW
ncbi:MAG: hypothetical protein ACO2OZ_02895 [Acidilobaceae archaeon]